MFETPVGRFFLGFRSFVVLLTSLLMVTAESTAQPTLVEDFDDGLAQEWVQHLGWPPVLNSVDGSSESPLNHIVDAVNAQTQPSPGSGEWGVWEAGEDGGLRTSAKASEQAWAWTADTLGFGTYEMEIGYEPHIGPEKRTGIVIFGSHNTGNPVLSMKSGLLIDFGWTAPSGIQLFGISPDRPLPGVRLGDANGQSYRPIWEGSDPNRLQLRIRINPDYTLDVWWSSVGDPWHDLWTGLDVSDYLWEWTGDPVEGLEIVGVAFAGYWGLASKDGGFHRYDNLSFTPHPDIPDYTLTLSSTIGGSVTSPAEGAFFHQVGSRISVQAEADADAHFVGWTGSAVDAGRVADPNNFSTTVVIDSNHTLVANFGPGSRRFVIEVESFDSVASQTTFEAAGPWALAGAAGMDALETVASGGEALYAGSLVQWGDGTDAFVGKRIELPSPGTYDVYVWTYRDEKNRSFQVQILSLLAGLAGGVVGAALPDGSTESGLYLEKLGSFTLDEQDTQSLIIELGKMDATAHVPVCDAILFAPAGNPLDGEPFLPTTLWSGVDPLDRPGGANRATNGSVERWAGLLPTGWRRHFDGASPAVAREASMPYVTDGSQAIKVTASKNVTGVFNQANASANTAYKVLVDTTLETGEAKFQINTTTNVVIDHVPMPSGGPHTFELTIVTGPDDRNLDIFFLSTVPGATFYVDNLRLIKIAEVNPDRSLPPDRTDIVQLRVPHYPEKNPNTVYPEITLTELENSIVLRGEFSRIVFDGDTGSISTADLRGRTVNPVSLPDAHLIDGDENEYFQRYARSSGLTWNTSADGYYYEIQSTVIPRTSEGMAASIGFGYLYRVHKEMGIILVYAQTFEVTPGGRYSWLCFRNGFGDSADMEVNHLAYYSHMAPPDYDRAGQPTFAEVISRDDEVIYSNHITSATWTNGAIALQVMENRTAGTQISDAYKLDPRALKYFTIQTRDDQRAVDFIAVRQPDAIDVTIHSGTTFAYALSLLPVHRHRPRVEFVGPGPIGQHPPFAPTTVPEIEIQEMAEMGVDFAYMGYPSFGLRALEVDRFRLQKNIRLLHKYGSRAWLGGVNTPNDFRKFMQWGWMTQSEVDRDVYYDVLRPPEQSLSENNTATGGWMCMNGPSFRDTLLDRVITDVLDTYGADASYLDIHTPLPCGNPAHGDDPVTVPIEGNLQFLQDFRENMAASGTTGKPFTGHCAWAFNMSYGLMDYTIPGEFVLDLPDTTMLNTIWTSLLYGVQAQFYTGEMNVSSAEFYQKVLSRGSIAYIFLFPTGVTSSFSYAERKMWIRYMTPLKIFNVENSTMHHPFDGDYSTYASVDTEDVFGILYRRPGDVLLVVTREDFDLAGEVQVTLEGSPLGLGTDVVVLDAHNGVHGTAREELLSAGSLTLDVELEDGPSIFRILNRPGSPTVIWHEPAVWNARTEAEGSRVTISATGVPHSRARALLWYGDAGFPEAFEGATLENGDTGGLFALLAMEFDEDARSGAMIERPEFRRGDVDTSGAVDFGDSIAHLEFLFLGSGEILCEDASDSNDDGLSDFTDAIHTLKVLFLGSEIIPAPGRAACGVDPTDFDPLSCGTYDACP